MYLLMPFKGSRKLAYSAKKLIGRIYTPLATGRDRASNVANLSFHTSLSIRKISSLPTKIRIQHAH